MTLNEENYIRSLLNEGDEVPDGIYTLTPDVMDYINSLAKHGKPLEFQNEEEFEAFATAYYNTLLINNPSTTELNEGLGRLVKSAAKAMGGGVGKAAKAGIKKVGKVAHGGMDVAAKKGLKKASKAVGNPGLLRGKVRTTVAKHINFPKWLSNRQYRNLGEVIDRCTLNKLPDVASKMELFEAGTKERRVLEAIKAGKGKFSKVDKTIFATVGNVRYVVDAANGYVRPLAHGRVGNAIAGLLSRKGIKIIIGGVLFMNAANKIAGTTGLGGIVDIGKKFLHDVCNINIGQNAGDDEDNNGSSSTNNDNGYNGGGSSWDNNYFSGPGSLDSTYNDPHTEAFYKNRMGKTATNTLTLESSKSSLRLNKKASLK